MKNAHTVTDMSAFVERAATTQADIKPPHETGQRGQVLEALRTDASEASPLHSLAFQTDYVIPQIHARLNELISHGWQIQSRTLETFKYKGRNVSGVSGYWLASPEWLPDGIGAGAALAVEANSQAALALLANVKVSTSEAAR